MFETFINVIHIIVAFFLILVVLVQGGHSGGIGAAFGGGNSGGVFGAGGATTFLGKLTYGAAFIFMVTSITLTFMSGKKGALGIKEKIEAREKTTETTSGNVPEKAPATPENKATAPTEQGGQENKPAAGTETKPADAAAPASGGGAATPASEKAKGSGQ